MHFIINKTHIVSSHRIDQTFVEWVCSAHRRHAQSVYDASLLEYNNSIRELLSTAMHPHKWWATLKSFFLVLISLYIPFGLMIVLLHMTHLKWQKFFLQLIRMNRVIRNSIILQLIFKILIFFIYFLIVWDKILSKKSQSS